MTGACTNRKEHSANGWTIYADTQDPCPVPWCGRTATLSLRVERCTPSSLPLFRSREARERPGRIGRASPLGTRPWSLLISTIDLSCDALRLLISNAEGGRIKKRGGVKVRGRGGGKAGGRQHQSVQRRDRVVESHHRCCSIHTVQINHRPGSVWGKSCWREGMDLRPLPDRRSRQGQDDTSFPLPEATLSCTPDYCFRPETPRPPVLVHIWRYTLLARSVSRGT